MKKILNFALFGIIVTFVSLPGLVLAETDLTTTNNQSTESAESFKKRQEARKKALKVSLTSSQKTRLQGRCKAAQGKLSSVSQRANGIATSRAQVHDNIVTHLESLVTKLKAKNIDTTKLEANILTLKQKIVTFNESLTAYRQAVSDLVAQECQTDPDAFQAALLAARTSLEQVKKDSKAVRDYLKNDIKPLLSEIRSQLEPKQEAN